MLQVGQAVREARKSRGWTQQEVADRSGVSISTVSRLESGWLPRADRLAAIAGQLDLTLDALLAKAAS